MSYNAKLVVMACCIVLVKSGAESCMSGGLQSSVLCSCGYMVMSGAFVVMVKNFVVKNLENVVMIGKIVVMIGNIVVIVKNPT